MRKASAAAGSALFFAVAPTVVAGVVPWALTGWHPSGSWSSWLPLRLLGGVVTAAAALVLLQAFARFVTEGLGTPAPVAPTEHLVVGGLYRWVRNPMYVAVTTAIVGQALLLRRPVLVAYAAVAWAVMATFSRVYEEPALRHQFGAPYEDYREAVPAWLPRRPR
jgi:protein-S-isoprenylcysteine O-methyltransferase Ste14